MDLKRKRFLFLATLKGAAIVLIASLFHYPIHFIDAVSNKTLTDFGLHISVWRIIFEPFLGLLMYFNRALYALDEFPMTLLWTLIIFIIYTVIQAFRTEKILRKHFIFTQLANLLLLLGLWFTIFVIMLFVPLPNNTIVNKSPNKILVTTHCHSEYSHDGLISQEDLWQWHKRNGFDAFFITDHNNHNKTLDFVATQRKGKLPSEPLVMCGEEFSGSNHLSLLGLKKKFSTKGFPDSIAVDSTHAQNGAVIVNHWFDGEKKSLPYFKNLGVDGFEIANTATDRSYDRNIYHKIKTFCEKNNLIMNGGLDFHGYGNLCSLWNAFEIPGWHNLGSGEKEAAILHILRNREQNKLTVVLYKDRPFYEKGNFFFSPVITLINYFRTLNFWQVLSWLMWIMIIAVVKTGLIDTNEKLKRITLNRIISLAGVFSSIFLLSLAFTFHGKIERLSGYNDIFIEYSKLLFYVGGALFIYAAITSVFRYRKDKRK